MNNSLSYFSNFTFASPRHNLSCLSIHPYLCHFLLEPRTSFFIYASQNSLPLLSQLKYDFFHEAFHVRSHFSLSRPSLSLLPSLSPPLFSPASSLSLSVSVLSLPPSLLCSHFFCSSDGTYHNLLFGTSI